MVDLVVVGGLVLILFGLKKSYVKRVKKKKDIFVCILFFSVAFSLSLFFPRCNSRSGRTPVVSQICLRPSFSIDTVSLPPGVAPFCGGIRVAQESFYTNYLSTE